MIRTLRLSVTPRRAILLVLAMVVVPMAVISRRAALHRGALRSWTATSSVVLRLTGAAAQAWIAERKGDLHLLTSDAARQPVLFRIAVPGHPVVSDARMRAALAHAVADLRHAHGAQYTRAWVFDAHGALVASSSGVRPHATIQALALAALATDSVLVSHVFDRPDGSMGIGFAQRVIYAGPGHPGGVPAGGVLGTVVLTVDPQAALFPSLDGGSIQGGDAATVLLMAHGDSVDEYALGGKVVHEMHSDPWRDVPRLERAAFASVLDSVPGRVGDDLALARPVPGMRWAVVRRAHASAVFAPADAWLLGECAAVAALAAVALWLALLRLRIARARRVRELAESERRYRLVTDNAMDVIARHGAEGRIDYVSPAITWVLGHEPDAIVGRTLAELGHPADAPAVATLFANARRHAGTSRAEHRLRDAEGNDVWVETLARAVGAAEHHGAGDVARDGAEIVTVTRDISTRKDAESALRDALEFVRAVVQSSPVAIIATDLDGRVVQWNNAAERLFGWTAAEIIGEPYPIAPGDLRDEMEEIRERTVMHEHVTDVSVRRQRKDGTLADVSMSTGVVHGAGGAPTGFVMLATDLTERVRLEMQLRQAQKMEAVGLLAGGIAHDFNNLLTVVTSYASLLLRDLPGGDPARDDLAEIHAAAERGAALVGQLLAFSRQQVLAPQPVNVNGLVSSMKLLLRCVLQPGITLQHQLGDEAGVIEADPGQIEQVLLNLVVNARDAIGDTTGTITITTACERHRDVRGGVAPDDGSRDVVITVRDTGCGIPGHLLEQIFDPFFTTKERGQGTGLGLSMVQGIVAQSGGRIAVRSEPGVGTTFELRFSAVDGDPPVPAETTQTLQAGGPAATLRGVVLLVEDDARVRRVTARILERAGYEVIAAADATEALAIYEEQAARIDIIVTDMMMPDLTGAELIARIRACGYDVPALLMSGHTARGPLDANAVDGSRFVQKPFAPDELTAKVREVMARRVVSSPAWALPTPGRLTYR